MNHTLVVTILVVDLVVLAGVLAWYVLLNIIGEASSAPGAGCLGMLVTLPLVVLVVVLLLFYSHGTSAEVTAEVTAYAALLAVVAGAFAWSMKVTKESLQNRAELLISEAVSRRSMERGEIRAMVYANSVLFRLSRSAYIDALNHLLATDRVVLIDGKYAMPKGGPKQT